MNCQACRSERIAHVTTKSQSCTVDVNRHERIGSVPSDMGIGSGTYLIFKYCLECGQIQGHFPLPATKLEQTSETAPLSNV